MARTLLFRHLRRALARKSSAPAALSRRHMLRLAAAVPLAACAPRFPSRPVAIVGGGVAGLTIAYRLARAGRAAVVYEASPRWGGRMFTRRDFGAPGMFCELGGELVDTNHTHLRALAQELGVGVQRLKTPGQGREYYHVDGVLRTDADMLASGRGAYGELAARIHDDQSRLLDSEEAWTAHARALDAQSVADYLHAARGLAPGWALDVIDLAYRGEYGMPTAEQSALNLVDFIGADPGGDFAMFGESDEAWRIEGGSSKLIDALVRAIRAPVTLRGGHALEAISERDGHLVLRFAAAGGVVAAAHDAVVLALPFTKLRGVEGIESLGLAPEKLRAIRELGYGDNAKVMVATHSRPWNGDAAGLPERASGEFYSSRFQVAWDTSRGQPGASGVLTNFLSGAADQNAALADLAAGLRAISPAIAESLDLETVASFFWAQHRFTGGSYAGAKVGQYTTLLEVAGASELGGRLLFAGEHTSPDFLGFMNGGVESGERVAAALLAQRAEAA
ncbi:MAG: flavin monoamine oxidase family protein [Hyphomonadaceae bacterium]